MAFHVYSDEELTHLYGEASPLDLSTPLPEVTPPPVAPEVGFKRLKQLADIPSKTVGSLFGDLTGLYGKILPGEVSSEDIQAAQDVAPAFDVGPTTGIGDVLLNKVAPEIAAWAIPYTGISKLGKMAGLVGRGGQILTEGLAQGGANLLSSSKNPEADVAFEGGIGAASGVLQSALPRWQRALPLAAVSAAQGLHDGNWTGAAANFAFNLLPGAIGQDAKAITTPVLLPSKFDLLNQEIGKILNPQVESKLNPGEFRFIDQIPPSQSSAETGTGNLFTPAPSEFSLQNARQPEFQMDAGQTPSGLRVEPLYPFEPSFSSFVEPPISTSDLQLENPRFEAPLREQGEFPIVKLQSENVLPPNHPNFTLVHPDVPQFQDTTGDLGNWRTEAVNRKPKFPLLENRVEATPPTPTKSLAPEVGPKVPETPVLSKNLKSEIEYHKNVVHDSGGGPISDAQAIERIWSKADTDISYFSDKTVPEYKENPAAARKAAKQAKVEFAESEAWLKQEGYLDSEGIPTPKMHKMHEADNLPQVMSPTGELHTPPPRQEGPHIISTVLDEGDGLYLGGDSWKTPHQKGDSIFNQQIENASGTGKSGFLVRDEEGIVKVLSVGNKANDPARMEAGRIADLAGQRPLSEKGKALQSEHLIDPVEKPKPQTVDQHTNVEKIQDAKILEDAKKVESKIQELTQEMKFAKEEGNEMAARAISTTIGKMRKSLASQAGFASPETMTVIAAGGLAGLVTYQQTKGDIGSALAAAFIVSGLGIAGAKAFKELKGLKGPEAKLSPTIAVPSEKIAEKLTQLARDTLRTPAGLAVGGRGGIWANTVRGAEDFLGLNRIEAYKDVKVKANGFIADILNQQAAALKVVSKVKMTPAFDEATGKFIRGQLGDPVEVQNLLNSGGIISTEGGAWSHLSTKEKAKYPEKWIQLDDVSNTNTKGDGVTIWYVTNAVKDKLVKTNQNALKTLATNSQDIKALDYAFETRKNLDVLQQVIFDAAGPKEGKRILGTTGQYVTRSHALISDSKFYPEEAVIQNAVDQLAVDKIKDFFSFVASGPVPIIAGGKTFHVTPEHADLFHNLFTPESLRAVVTQQIKEIKAYGEASRQGLIKGDESQLQGGLFTGRKELDTARQILLGTHTGTQEMVRATFNKLLPAAHSAHSMLGFSKLPEASGLPGRFASDLEYNKTLNDLRRSIPLATDSRIAREIQNNINELGSYIPIGTDAPGMGLFQGSFVSRHVHAQLEEALNPFGVLDSVMGKGLQQFNSLFKETHLLLNPVVQARNAVQVPFMLVIGRAVHDIKALETAYNIVMKNETSTAIGRWAVQNGATSGNPIRGEFHHSLEELIDGTADRTIFEKMFSKTTSETSVHKALLKGEFRAAAHLAYAKPDDFVRTATFIAAARREAKVLGVAEDVMHLDARVTDAAREFMNRRTMDYANVPKWVKVGRQIPLISPFMTYSHEIVRITKNMAVDAAKGDLVSGAGLAGMSIFPFLAQQQAEESLSSVDREAWKKGAGAAQDYSRPRFKLPMSRNSDGSFNYYDITSIMPFGDYLMMGRALAKGDLGAVASVNPIAGVEKSPLLNLAAAQITGKDIHTQREFRDSWDRAKNVLQAITPPLTPGIGSDYKKIVPEFLGGSLGQTNIVTGRTNTIKGALLRNILGIDESQFNPDIAVATMIKIAQHDIANERQYFNDALRSNGLSIEAKKRASDRYIQAVKTITDQIAERLK